MATTTPRIGLNKPGFNETGWDTLLNQNADVLDAQIGTLLDQAAVSGSATGGSATTLADTGLALTPNVLNGAAIIIRRAGVLLRVETIVSHTATTFTFATGTTVQAGDTYAVISGAGIPTSEKGAANGVASLNASSLVIQDPASKGVAGGVASLDANTEVVELPAGAAAANVRSVLKADGTWFRPGTRDYLTLPAGYYPTSASTWLNVTGWSALQLTNFTYANGIFTCAKAGRYRVIFSVNAYNATAAAISILSRINFSVAGARSRQSHTFASTASAYHSQVSEAIEDMAVGDTFSAQYYTGSTANGSCYLQAPTELLIEEL